MVVPEVDDDVKGANVVVSEVEIVVNGLIVTVPDVVVVTLVTVEVPEL